MKDFRELLLPEQEHNDPSHTGDWFVYTDVQLRDGKPRKFLTNNDTTLVSLCACSNRDILYFKDEYTAHAAACRYYATHGEPYPYHDEWNITQLKIDTNTTTIIQSQEMKFK